MLCVLLGSFKQEPQFCNEVLAQDTGVSVCGLLFYMERWDTHSASHACVLGRLSQSQSRRSGVWRWWRHKAQHLRLWRNIATLWRHAEGPRLVVWRWDVACVEIVHHRGHWKIGLRDTGRRRRLSLILSRHRKRYWCRSRCRTDALRRHGGILWNARDRLLFTMRSRGGDIFVVVSRRWLQVSCSMAALPGIVGVTKMASTAQAGRRARRQSLVMHLAMY